MFALDKKRARDEIFVADEEQELLIHVNEEDIAGKNCFTVLNL